MAFDALPAAARTVASPAAAIDAAEPLCPVWAAQNPDRALAFLFVAPQDGPAVDAVIAR